MEEDGRRKEGATEQGEARPVMAAGGERRRRGRGRSRRRGREQGRGRQRPSAGGAARVCVRDGVAWVRVRVWGGLGLVGLVYPVKPFFHFAK